MTKIHRAESIPVSEEHELLLRKEAAGHGLLTTAQAAAFIGYTPRMLEARRVRGGGPKFVRISGRAVRYRIEDLNDWIEKRLVSNTAQRVED